MSNLRLQFHPDVKFLNKQEGFQGSSMRPFGQRQMHVEVHEYKKVFTHHD